MFTVYTKDGCPQCDSAKKLLTANQAEFEAIKIGEGITMAEFKTTFPYVRAVPFILKDEKPLGGYAELVNSLKVR